MEQSNQEINQKPVLLIKTKIAIWWVRIFFILVFLLGITFSPWLANKLMVMIPFFETLRLFSMSLLNFTSWPLWTSMFFVPVLFFAPLSICPLFLSFLSSFFVMRRKKWAWITLVILLFLIMVPMVLSNLATLLLLVTGGAPVNFSYWLPVILFWDLLILIPLILLLLDRKNFFKIAS